MTKVWNACGYVRLSREDGDREESNSVTGQKDLIRDFFARHSDLRECGMKVDDGFTGSNFQRPAFQEMIADVKAGKINCIVVKDLSRFGRNYKEAGDYLQHIFPLLGVRFIAVNDNFDTETAEKNEYGFIVPLKNIMNDTYSRDISRKVSSAIAAKELHGEFIGVFAPYGYKKSESDHHKLEVNEATAPVIREIFALRVQGMGYAGIARQLNSRGIPSPGAYLYRCGLTDRESYRDALWTAWNIKEILRNEIYLGHLVQGKRTQAHYKQPRKERYAPAGEWRITRDAHEAIIDSETFAAAQRLAEERRDIYEASLGKADDWKTPNLFRGLIRCADCGTAMVRRHVYSRSREGRSYYYSYLCPKSLQKAGACTPKNLMERELLTVASDTLRAHIDAVAALEVCISAIWETQTAERRKSLSREREEAEQELSRCSVCLDGLYPNLVNGILSRQEYAALKERYLARSRAAEARLEELKARQRELMRYSPANPMFETHRVLRGTDGLSEELIHALIARIEVHDGNRLDIKLVYQDEFLALTRFAEGASAP